MKVLLLSGGVGGARFARGLQDVLVRWDLVRPVLGPDGPRRPPAGFLVSGVSVDGWTSR